MSAAKHSITVVPSATRALGDDGAVALFQASCLCGWRAGQTYRLHARAVRAYYRHLGTPR